MQSQNEHSPQNLSIPHLHLNAPLVAYQFKDSELPVLISGFRRHYANSNTDSSTYPVIVYDRNDFTGAFKKIGIDNDGHMALLLQLHCLNSSDHHPMEFAFSVSRATRVLNIKSHRLANMFPRISNHPDYRQIMKVATLAPAVIKRLLRERLDLNKSALIATLNAADRPVFMVISARLTTMSVSRIRRIISLSTDLALREKTTISQVLKNCRKTLMSQLSPDSNVAPETIVDYLYSRRYPTGANLTEQFELIKKGLNLPACIDLSAPAFFEGDHLNIQLRIKSITELEQAMELMDLSNDSWKQCFDLLHGKTE